MAATVLTLDAAKKAKLGLVEDGRGAPAVHSMIVAYRANRRTGSANTKTRGEVAATGKKPFRQKGTGRARQGGNASPVTRGGGVAFGPRPRDYTQKLPKKVKRLAFRKALSERIAAEDVLSVKDFAIADGKTKTFVNQVTELAGTAHKVLVIGSFDTETYRAGRNSAGVLMITADEVNAEHLLFFDKIIITAGAMEVLVARTAA